VRLLFLFLLLFVGFVWQIRRSSDDKHHRFRCFDGRSFLFSPPRQFTSLIGQFRKHRPCRCTPNGACTGQSGVSLPWFGSRESLASLATGEGERRQSRFHMRCQEFEQWSRRTLKRGMMRRLEILQRLRQERWSEQIVILLRLGALGSQGGVE
jgi:hypothetical protein